MLNVQQVSC